MRITGGALRGRKLCQPTTRAVRPMRDAVRQALFNIWGERIAGARFLDLFAGTGSVGLEALSRGAVRATFVEKLPAALATLRENIAALGLGARCQVIAQDAFQALERLEGAFDAVFVGPPYGQGLAECALLALAQSAVLAPGGTIAVEVFHKETLAPRYGTLVEVDRRRYGDNVLVLYTWEEAPIGRRG